MVNRRLAIYLGFFSLFVFFFITVGIPILSYKGSPEFGFWDALQICTFWAIISFPIPFFLCLGWAIIGFLLNIRVGLR